MKLKENFLDLSGYENGLQRATRWGAQASEQLDSDSGTIWEGNYQDKFH